MNIFKNVTQIEYTGEQLEEFYSDLKRVMEVVDNSDRSVYSKSIETMIRNFSKKWGEIPLVINSLYHILDKDNVPETE